MESTKNNKLIAEFMGVSELISEKTFLAMEHKAHNPTIIEYLKYHTSWDALIPVIAKVNSFVADKVVPKGFPNIGSKLQESILTNNIFIATECMVEAIRWYNQNMDRSVLLLEAGDEFPPIFWELMKTDDYLEATVSNIALADDWIKVWKPGAHSQKGGLWMWSNKIQKLRRTTMSEYYGNGIVD